MYLLSQVFFAALEGLGIAAGVFYGSVVLAALLMLLGLGWVVGTAVGKGQTKDYGKDNSVRQQSSTCEEMRCVVLCCLCVCLWSCQPAHFKGDVPWVRLYVYELPAPEKDSLDQCAAMLKKIKRSFLEKGWKLGGFGAFDTVSSSGSGGVALAIFQHQPNAKIGLMVFHENQRDFERLEKEAMQHIRGLDRRWRLKKRG